MSLSSDCLNSSSNTSEPTVIESPILKGSVVGVLKTLLSSGGSKGRGSNSYRVQDLIYSPSCFGITLVQLHQALDGLKTLGWVSEKRKKWQWCGPQNARVGLVSLHREGYGFVSFMDQPQAKPQAKPKPPYQQCEDWYVSRRYLHKVLTGDEVLVCPAGPPGPSGSRDNRSNTNAVLLALLEEKPRRLLGQVGVHRQEGFVFVPKEKGITKPMVLTPTKRKLKTHDWVWIQLHNRCVDQAPFEVVLCDKLGQQDNPDVEIEIAVRKFKLPHHFSKAARGQAKMLPKEVVSGSYDAKERQDLRHLPLVTIDGEDARDFDDAVHCQSLGPKKGWRLWVAIADVSHYVHDGDALDGDARYRATSVYFPRRVLPMLPENLSNGLCSLNPQVDRLALVCEMEIGARGKVRKYRFYPAVIRSWARLTYDKVWKALSGDQCVLGVHQDRFDDLCQLHALFKVLVVNREKRGALDFDMPEAVMQFNKKGWLSGVVPRLRNDAHRMIEECMLAANVCAAKFLRKHKHPTLYRVHPPPTEEKRGALKKLLDVLGVRFSAKGKPKPSDYARVVEAVQDRPERDLVQVMVLRSMQQAFYTCAQEGHFGLAYDAYAHFTSPIRRYPDLLTHRAIKAVLKGGVYLPGAQGDVEHVAHDIAVKKGMHPAWESIGQHCSSQERLAEDASRDVAAYLKCQLMREHVGQRFTGKVSSLVPFGLFVVLDDIFVEGLVHISGLGKDYFELSSAGHEMRGRHSGQVFRLGDVVEIDVQSVNEESRFIDFALYVSPTKKQKRRRRS